MSPGEENAVALKFLFCLRSDSCDLLLALIGPKCPAATFRFL